MRPDIRVHLVWYWEGPVSRYFVPPERWRSSRELSLWWLRRGSVSLRWQRGRREVNHGHWIMPPPMLRNENFSPDAEVVSMRFEMADTGGTMLFRPEEPIVFPYTGAAGLNRSVRSLRTYLSRDLNWNPSYKCEEPVLSLRQALQVTIHTSKVFHEFLTRVEELGLQPAAAGEPTHPALIKALDSLKKRDLRIPLREADLAGTAGVSLPHLRRLFREKLGSTIKAWDSKRVTNSVRTSLRESGMSVKETAFAHGFSSPSHLCRWFRSVHYCTPGNWLEEHRSDGVV